MTPGERRDIPAPDHGGETEATKPLPPLPDGGLRGAMPAWLRQPPAFGSDTTFEREPTERANPNVVDVRSFLSADDLPEWLRRLAADDEVRPPVPIAQSDGERSTTIQPTPPVFPRRFDQERRSAAPSARPFSNNGQTAHHRSSARAKSSIDAPSGPSLVWPLFLFGVVTIVLVVAFLVF